MKNNLRRIGINMLSGGIGYIVPMAINLFSTPYVLNTLGEEAFGLQVLANVIIGYLVVADMGLDIPITKKIAEYYASDQTAQKSKFLVATIKMYFLIGLVGMMVLLLFAEKLIKLLSVPPAFYPEARLVFYMTSIGFVGSILNMWGKAVFNGIHRYDIANGISIFNNLFGILIGIVLIMNGYGVVGFFLARIVGFIISNVLYIFLASRFITTFTVFPLIDLQVWDYLKKQVGYGFSLRISGMIFLRMDQALISSWLGVAILAVYSIPILIATAVSGLISSVTHFAFPMASAMNSTHSPKEVESFFFNVSKFIVVISTLTFIPLVVLGDKFLAVWISHDIAMQSQYVLLILVIAFYINTCLTTAVTAFMVGTGHLKTFTIYGVVRGVVLFIGFIVFIKMFGLEGAGYSYMVSVILDFVLFFYALKTKLIFNIASLLMEAYLKPVSLGVLLGGALIPLRNYIHSWIELILAVGAYLVVYCVAAWKINIFEEREKTIMYKLLAKLGMSFNH
jgi:O-antigen/teichoic acid export membrane protein